MHTTFVQGGNIWDSALPHLHHMSGLWDTCLEVACGLLRYHHTINVQDPVSSDLNDVEWTLEQGKVLKNASLSIF